MYLYKSKVVHINSVPPLLPTTVHKPQPSMGLEATCTMTLGAPCFFLHLTYVLLAVWY